jgi:hypothetical protein
MSPPASKEFCKAFGANLGDGEFAYLPTKPWMAASEETRLAADAGAILAAADLGVEPPELVWLSVSTVDPKLLDGAAIPHFTRGSIKGIAHPEKGYVGIMGNLSPGEAAEVAAHETFHIRPERKHQDTTQGKEQEERRARAYGARVGKLLADNFLLKASPKIYRIDDRPKGNPYLHERALPGDIVIGLDLKDDRAAYVNISHTRFSPTWASYTEGALT